ncbi:22995_t:CDS:10 [Racocetra persica]|uniref:22995_t:CDS:1 n=1 Tax=Racocetra persica TaxID=160502 RepID=A0ACA9KDJ6_9GLOM|nr:22995_t:CDS:10 [Racocetra persica]
MSNSSGTKRRRGTSVVLAQETTTSTTTPSRASPRATSSRVIPQRTIVTPPVANKGKTKVVVSNSSASSSTSKGKGKRKAVNDDRKEKAIDNNSSTSSNNKGKRKAEDSGEENSSSKKTKIEDSSEGTSSKPKKKKKEKKARNKVKEKRQARVRTICSKKIKDRINRASSQRMYLIDRKEVEDLKKEFTVLGSTGNVYTVTITHIPNCTCPDYQGVLRVNPNSQLIYQRALISKELKVIFSRAPDLGTLASYRVRSLYHVISKGRNGSEGGVRRRLIEGDCPICCDPLRPEHKDQIVWCQNGCGNNIHKECFDQWKGSRIYTRVTCVYCRVEWHEHVLERYTEDGYLNLGQFQAGLGTGSGGVGTPRTSRAAAAAGSSSTPAST